MVRYPAVPAPRRPLSELNLIDDFLFYSILSHKQYGEPFARMLLEIILQRKFEKIRIHTQEVIYGSDTNRHGVRLDVMIEEDSSDITLPGGLFDLEVDQNRYAEAVAALPMRTRYYHSSIDRKALEAGNPYGKLYPVYVIMIMNYDPWGQGRLLYTVKRTILLSTRIWRVYCATLKTRIRKMQ